MPIDLSAELDSLDGLPEAVPIADLFQEGEDGKYRIVPIAGLKSESDVTKLQSALTKERNDHRKARDRWKALGDRDPEDVTAALDEVEELRARIESGEGGGKLSEEELEELVEKRMARSIKPLQRQLDTVTAERDQAVQLGTTLRADLDTTIISQQVNDLGIKSCNPDALPDVRMAAKFMLERNEDGETVTKDGLDGIAPGMPVEMWMTEMLDKRPTWNKPTGGGGGGKGGGGTGGVTKNPFTFNNWSMAAQNELLRTKGRDAWETQARAAGVDPKRPKRPPAPNGQVQI